MSQPSNGKAANGKTRALWIFFGVAMLVAVLLAVFLSPWASSSPDGLEKVAEDKGFLESAEGTEPAWKHSPVPDYAVSGIENERVATGLAGFVGVLITAAVIVLLALAVGGFSIVRKRKAAGAAGND